MKKYKVIEVLRMLRADGWELKTCRGGQAGEGDGSGKGK